MPWRSRRAAGGLRGRPSESRALFCFLAIGRHLMCAGPEPRPLAYEMRNSMMQCRMEDLKTSAHISGIRAIMPSTSRWRRRIPSTSFCGRKLSYLQYDRAKNIGRRSLSTSTTMITGPDRNRRHRIVSALSLRSCQATGGLRRPPAAVGKPSFACFSADSLPVGWAAPPPKNQRIFRDV